MTDRQFFGAIAAVFTLFFLGCFATYFYAHSLPEDQLTCEYRRDVLFVSGERVSVRECGAWGFTVIDDVVRHDEARLVGRCGDHIYYFNREDQFPQGCEWIERTPDMRYGY